MYFLNRAARVGTSPSGLFAQDEYDRVRRFAQSRLPASPTPLLNLQELAAALGVRGILLKDESCRWALNAFKILGVSYAVRQLVERRAITRTSVLTCATDGNHGRAVAHVAREFGLKARVYVHALTTKQRIDAIKHEGADVAIVNGNYDDAVREAAQDANRFGWTMISDTSWPGYEQVPRDIMAGYTILMDEAVKQWNSYGIPNVIFVQAGVGSLLCAVVSWLCQEFGAQRPRVVCCEPSAAACLLESARAGKRITISGSLRTVMDGLSCGTASSLAWPVISLAVDAFVAIADQSAEQAVRVLATPKGDDPKVAAGESGACGLGAFLSVFADPDMRPLCEALGLNSDSRVFVINTEEATDGFGYSCFAPRPSNRDRFD